MSAEPVEVQCVRSAKATWFTRCRCPDCRVLNERSRKRIRVTGASGPDLSEAANAALDRMLAAGRTPAEIATAAGLRPRALGNQISLRRRGGWRRMSLSRAEALIRAERVVADARVPVVGTRRRLQALAVAGHSVRDVAARIGVPHRTLDGIWKYATVRAEIANAVAGAYEELLRTPGRPDVAGLARSKGWAPAAAWDDPDDPRERPKGMGGTPHGQGKRRTVD